MQGRLRDEERAFAGAAGVFRVVAERAVLIDVRGGASASGASGSGSGGRSGS
jgi:hypothetical protein